MTHRLFWLTVGAGVGISGYRRVNRAVRGFTRSAIPRRRVQIAGLAEFARDVRDGMDLYQEEQRLNIERRRAPAVGHLSGQRSSDPAPDVHLGADAAGGSRDGARELRASRAQR